MSVKASFGLRGRGDGVVEEVRLNRRLGRTMPCMLRVCMDRAGGAGGAGGLDCGSWAVGELLPEIEGIGGWPWEPVGVPHQRKHCFWEMRNDPGQEDL